jgi:hypothetical protein
MTLDDFRQSLTAAKPPAELSPALLGLWWDAKDDWKRAQESAQQDEGPDSGGSCGRLITCSENELGGSKKQCLRNMSERSVCDSRIMSTVFGYWHREVAAPAGSSFLGLGVVRDWARQIGSRVDVYPCSALWQRPLLAQDATQSSIARLPEAGVRQGAWLRVRGRSGQGFGPKQNPLGGNQSSRQRPA